MRRPSPSSLWQAAFWLHKSWMLLDNGAAFSSNGLIVKGNRRALLLDTTWPTAELLQHTRSLAMAGR